MSLLSRIVFPDLCPICVRRERDDSGGFACTDCIQELTPLRTPRCLACGGHLDTVLESCSECLSVRRPWGRAVSAFAFGGLPRQLVHRFKYQGNVALTHVLVAALVDAWTEHGDGDLDLVTAVPLHWRKAIRRGYNQSELLGRDLAKTLALPYQRLLRRPQATRAQAGLDYRERQRNLRHAFAPARNIDCKGAHVLLLDDVFTTGATLDHCARILKKAGATAISVITVARG
ncbi:MAG: ComF family protein [Rhodothermales bacterium]|jgi:ComF family protein